MATSLTHDRTVPDSELFKTRFPVFTPVPDQLVAMIIDEMTDHIGGHDSPDRWRARDFQPAILYLTAHALTLQGEPERSVQIAQATGNQVLTGSVQGSIEKVKVGDVETTFEAGTGQRTQLGATSLAGLSGDKLDYSLTHYGRQYVKIRRKNFGGPRVFT